MVKYHRVVKLKLLRWLCCVGVVERSLLSSVVLLRPVVECRSWQVEQVLTLLGVVHHLVMEHLATDCVLLHEKAAHHQLGALEVHNRQSFLGQQPLELARRRQRLVQVKYPYPRPLLWLLVALSSHLRLQAWPAEDEARSAHSSQCENQSWQELDEQESA